jgi:hypothetical protein
MYEFALCNLCANAKVVPGKNLTKGHIKFPVFEFFPEIHVVVVSVRFGQDGSGEFGRIPIIWDAWWDKMAELWWVRGCSARYCW